MSANTTIKENTSTTINGKPINGLNPDAVQELESAGKATDTKVVKDETTGTTTVKAARAVPEWVAVTGTVASQSQMGLLTLKADTVVTYGGKEFTFPKDAEVNLLQRNQDASVYKCSVRAPGVVRTILFPIPADAIQFPGNGPSAPRSRANDINDELAQACLDIVKLIGKMPLGVATDSKTESEWAVEFPNCTLANIADAVEKIEAFRANRGKMLTEAIKAKDETAIKAALHEYGRAKSWEQDVRSTGKNCGIL